MMALQHPMTLILFLPYIIMAIDYQRLEDLHSSQGNLFFINIEGLLIEYSGPSKPHNGFWQYISLSMGVSIPNMVQFFTGS